MKQPHTEQTIEHTGDQQNTGNHKKPGAADAKGADTLGGTRAGAENVEHGARSDKAESVETGPDIDRVSGLDEVNTSTKQVGGNSERSPERDEHGRM